MICEDWVTCIVMFILSSDGEMPDGVGYVLPVFAGAASIFGLLLVVLDYLGSLIGQKSFLKLSHSLSKLPLFLLVWGFGAGLVAFFGVAFDILMVNRHTAIVAGIAWPVIMTRIAATARGEQEPEQPGQATEEEE